MFGSKTLALCCLSSAAALAVAPTAAQTFVYEFDPATAAGVRGNIKVQYAGATKADVSADLDFSKLDVAAVKKADGNCTTAPTQYKWHIHVKWNSTQSSGAFAQCSLAATGNHYDPLFACGANSEFAATPQCASKIPTYACSPANYTANPGVCEKGDLSGKFGDFKVDAATQRVSGKWTDAHYPLVSENTPQWNIILHAVCGKNTPRVACALGKRVHSHHDTSDGKPGLPTPLTPNKPVATPASSSTKHAVTPASSTTAPAATPASSTTKPAATPAASTPTPAATPATTTGKPKYRAHLTFKMLDKHAN